MPPNGSHLLFFHGNSPSTKVVLLLMNFFDHWLDSQNAASGFVTVCTLKVVFYHLGSLNSYPTFTVDRHAESAIQCNPQDLENNLSSRGAEDIWTRILPIAKSDWDFSGLRISYLRATTTLMRVIYHILLAKSFVTNGTVSGY